MTATNATEDKVVDDDKAVTEDDLRALKYDNTEVETSKEADESEESEEENDKETEETDEDDAKADDSKEDEEESDDESEEDKPSFVKEFPNIKGDTPEEYAKNLEEAYKNSTGEALRLKDLVNKGTPTEDETTDKPAPGNYLEMYAQQKLDDDIASSYAKFKVDYPQVDDAAEYSKFIREVETLTNTIMTSQGRVAPPSELYNKAAVILGWEKQSSEPTEKEKLAMALKNNASTSKSTPAAKKASKSKVTDQMIAVNRAMYPGKTDAQIREELEPYVK